MQLLFYNNLSINKLFFFSLFFLWSVFSCKAQGNLYDSIVKELKIIEISPDFSTKNTTYINLLHSLSYEMRYRNLDSLLILSGLSLKYSKSANYTKGESKSYTHRGNYYLDKGKYSDAINDFNNAIRLAEKINNIKLIIENQVNLAIVYEYQEDYTKALNSYLKALKLATSINNKLMLSVINGNIAILYADQKDYKEALRFYDKVNVLNEETGNSILIAETASNTAEIYAETGDYEEALTLINKGINEFKIHKITDWLAYCYRVKGKIYLEQDRYKWALNWYQKSLNLHDKLDDEIEHLFLLTGMAETYLGLNKTDISEKYALDAYKIANKIKSRVGIMESSEILYKINKNKQDYATALKYLETYKKTSASSIKEEEKRGLTMFKAKIEYEKQQQELITNNEKALAKKQSYINVALAITLISILIIVLIFKSRSIQKKLNKELEKQKTVLIKREVELRDSNDTKNMLFSIIGHDLRGPIGGLENMLNLFNEGDIKSDEFLDLVPKLREDVNITSFTLNNLLYWSQTQMDGSKTKPSNLVLKKIVEQNIKLLSKTAKDKSISIINEVEDNTITWADANHIDIVLRNLMNNALKFTPKDGTIVISVNEKEKAWEIAVKDTGVGLDKETQGKIFNKSTNLSTYGTNNEKGTGIGLSLCKEMIKKNNGTIWVKSTLGKGSVFYFTLPKAK